MSLTKEQSIQEEEYSFPYHYIPQFGDNFTQAVCWQWGLNYCATIEFLLDKLEKKSFNTLVDVGTGDGRLVREIAKRFPNKSIKGVDYSQHAINLAKSFNPRLHFECLDITKSTNEKYDIITLIEVFEHIPIDICTTFVKGLASLLNKNGSLLLTVPHTNKPVSEKHFQHFTKEKIMTYFSDEFEVVEYKPIDKVSRFVRYAKKLFYNKYFIIQSPYFNNLLFKYVKKCFTNTNESNCGRIYLELKLK
ncbi:class I SAM-dependent methyltransferase [Halobacteriovorax sp.]|uniref:class I SAM-dependent methyltransferase n=1 Tax=Halobacteriovorax sp. TaxID=2020862 RepID=UPI003AF2CE2F